VCVCVCDLYSVHLSICFVILGFLCMGVYVMCVGVYICDRL
jgi:hypothetical protein